ncbi:MAG: helix-hairpin-helix domain-containing protein [Anaerolineales bacterium]
MKAWWSIPLGILIGLILSGFLFYAISPPRGQAVELHTPPTATGLTVYVSGAVNQAGMYTLPIGSRINDALHLAGGARQDAYLENVNLAAAVKDGQHIFIPWSYTTPTATKSPNITPTATKSPFININTANQAELESLPGIGAVLSQRIIAYRTRYGAFKTLQDLLKVYGIKPATIQLIEPYVIVEP